MQKFLYVICFLAVVEIIGLYISNNAKLGKCGIEVRRLLKYLLCFLYGKRQAIKVSINRGEYSKYGIFCANYSKI